MFVFYLIYAVLYLAFQKAGGSFLYLCLCGAIVLCPPAMFFLAGQQAAREWGRKDFAHRSFFRAGLSFLFYIVIGVPAVHFLKGQDLFLSVRNILAINTIPGLCSILITLGFLYLICAFLHKSNILLADHKKAALALSIIGVLLTFLPEGLTGYALVGIFIGGDNFGAVPILWYLPAFFWGMSASDPETFTPRYQRNWNYAALLAAAGVLFLLVHNRSGLYVAVGTILAFLVVWAGRFLIPAVRKVEQKAFHIGKAFLRALSGLEQEEGHRFKKGLVFLGIYLVLFGLTATVVFLPQLEQGRSLLWTGDALSQYVPKIHRFVKYIPEVFSALLKGTDIPQYDFTSGLGTPMSITWEPLYWLYLLIHPANIDYMYTFMTMLRFFLAGLSLTIMLRCFRRSWISCWGAGIAYAFSCYAVYAGTRHFQFITPLILLPLMVVAMERLIRDGKWLLMAFLVALSVLTSYYFLYMETIALGVYFLCRILFDREYRHFKTFLKRGLAIVASYILGASMGCVSLAMSFGSYLGSGRTSSGNRLLTFLKDSPLYYRAGWIADVFLSSVSYNFTPGYWLKIGTVPLALFGAVFLFTRKERRDLRAVFVVLTAFCVIPLAGFVLGGFSTLTNRWSYIYTVLAGYLIAYAIDESGRLGKRDLLAAFFVAAYYVLLVCFDNRMHFTSMIFDMAFVVCTLAVLLFLNLKKVSVPPAFGKTALVLVTLLAVAINGMMYNGLTKENGKPRINSTQYNSAELNAHTSLRDLGQVAEPVGTGIFYRSTDLVGTGDTNCFSMINGHYDPCTFTSTLAGGIVDYNTMMGNISATTVRVYDYNFRTYPNELASVRYLGTTSKNHLDQVPYGYRKIYETKDGLPLYENQYPLPLGYTYDTVLGESEAEKLPVARRQEATMLAAIVPDEDAEDSVLPSVSADTAGGTAHRLDAEITCDGVSMGEDTLDVQKDGATIKLSFQGEPNAETYIVYKGKVTSINEGAKTYKSVSIRQGKDQYRYLFRTDAYSLYLSEHVLNLGYHEEAIDDATLTFKNDGTLPFEGIEVWSQPMSDYETKVNALKEESLAHVSIQNNTVRGDISVGSDKLLVLSLPYQKGWTAWVDGKETPIIPANYQYMGLALSPGHHEIRLHYQMPGLSAAGKISLAGITVFLILLVLTGIHRRKKKPRISKTISDDQKET